MSVEQREATDDQTETKSIQRLELKWSCILFPNQFEIGLFNFWFSFSVSGFISRVHGLFSKSSIFSVEK